MAGLTYTTPSVPVSDISLSGGLNSTAGALGLANNEASDLQNIDFNKFGSILKRSGYSELTSSAITGTPDIDGLWWYEYESSGVLTRYAIIVAGAKVYKMDALDGTPDNITITTTMSGRNIIFTGSGLNDMSIGGTYSGSTQKDFYIEIDAEATPDTFKWSNDGGSTFEATTVAITGAAQTLEDGVTITFAATTGHTDTETWEFTTGVTITAGSHCDFTNFLNEVYVTNGTDPPFKWMGTTGADIMTTPSGLTNAKFNTEFNNYLFLANVQVSGVWHQSRIYWSTIKDTDTWSATAFIEVAKNDGQEITGIKVLGDRLVVYKTRSIYNVFFTGDADIPFILPGGGKSNSPVGCIAPFSIQEVENNHIFLSDDGIYIYDGFNAKKVSQKITTTLSALNPNKFAQAVSLVQKAKNRYMLSMTSSGATENDTVIVWDYFNNAFSKYDGIDACSMAIFYVDGIVETLYFGDYAGWVYEMDTGNNDNPLGVETAIDGYYKTNWKHYNDLVDKKGIAHVVIYHSVESTTLSFAYSYDFENADQYSQSFSMQASADVYGTGVYGTATYANSGGAVERRDLLGRGRVVRFHFSNDAVDEPFRIDGFGTMAHLETVA